MSHTSIWSKVKRIKQKWTTTKHDSTGLQQPEPQQQQQQQQQRQHESCSCTAAAGGPAQPDASRMRRQSTQASQDSGLSPSGCADPHHRFFSGATITASTNIPDRALGPTGSTTPSVLGPLRLSDTSDAASVYVIGTAVSATGPGQMLQERTKSRFSQSGLTTPEVSGSNALQSLQEGLQKQLQLRPEPPAPQQKQQPQQHGEQQQGQRAPTKQEPAAVPQQAEQASTRQLLHAASGRLAYIYSWLDGQIDDTGAETTATDATPACPASSVKHVQQHGKQPQQQGMKSLQTMSIKHSASDKDRMSCSGSSDGGSPRIGAALRDTCAATVGSGQHEPHTKWRSPTSSSSSSSSSDSSCTGDGQEDAGSSRSDDMGRSHSSAGKTPYHPKRAASKQHQQQSQKQSQKQQQAPRRAATASLDSLPSTASGGATVPSPKRQQPGQVSADDSHAVDCVVDLVGLSHLLPTPKWQPGMASAATATERQPQQHAAAASGQVSAKAGPRRSQTLGQGMKRQPESSVQPGAAEWAAAERRLDKARRGSKMIAVARHCPEDMLCDQWCIDDFVLRRKLHEGHLSCVVAALHKPSGRSVAIKIYKRSRLHAMERIQLAREICLHVRTMHPHIVSLYAAWKDAQHVYLALECARGGNLLEALLTNAKGRTAEDTTAKRVAKPLLMALAHLHSQGLIHRDVKLENVLMDDDTGLKLADLGLSIDAKAERANTRLGTFGYFAPEVLDCPLKASPLEHKAQPGRAGSATAELEAKAGDPGCCPGGVCGSSGCQVADYDSKVDVWSAGVLLYELLTGRAPFAASTPPRILEAIRRRPVVYPAYLSAEAVSLLSRMLHRDPAQRATARELLSHAWFQKHCARRPTAAAAAAAAAAQAADSTAFLAGPSNNAAAVTS